MSSNSRYQPPTPEELFPAPKAERHHLQQWEDNPVTSILLAELRREDHRLRSEALNGDTEEFLIAKGQAKTLTWLFDQLDLMRDQIIKASGEANK